MSRMLASNLRRMPAVMVCLFLMLGLWCWLEARGLASRQSSYQALVAQIEQMDMDALRITTLQDAPRLATERERPNDELLAEIRDSIAEAGMPLERWIGNDPAQPIRVSRSPYKQLSTRLSFERVTLRELVSFAFHLIGTDPALNVSDFRLVAPRGNADARWNAEVTVSYLIYSPYQPRRTS